MHVKVTTSTFHATCVHISGSCEAPLPLYWSMLPE